MASSVYLFSASIFAALSLPSLVTAAVPAASRHLTPITGKALQRLITGSIVTEVSENGQAGPAEMYFAEGIYQFLGHSAVSVRARYVVQQTQVCILANPEKLCFSYFKDHQGRYWRLKLQLSDGVYRKINVSAIDSYKS